MRFAGTPPRSHAEFVCLLTLNFRAFFLISIIVFAGATVPAIWSHTVATGHAERALLFRNRLPKKNQLYRVLFGLLSGCISTASRARQKKLVFCYSSPPKPCLERAQWATDSFPRPFIFIFPAIWHVVLLHTGKLILQHFLQRRDFFDIFASKQGAFCAFTFPFLFRRNDISGGPCRGAPTGVSPPRRAHSFKKTKQKEKTKNKLLLI